MSDQEQTNCPWCGCEPMKLGYGLSKLPPEGQFEWGCGSCKHGIEPWQSKNCELNVAEIKVERLEAEVKQLRERLREQTAQTQQTARQIHEKVAAELLRAGTLPEGHNIYGHPIEQSVATCLSVVRGEVERLQDDIETAWGIIANAYGGDWEQASAEWRAAAERWRDKAWHRIASSVKDSRPEKGVAEPPLKAEAPAGKSDATGSLNHGGDCDCESCDDRRGEVSYAPPSKAGG